MLICNYFMPCSAVCSSASYVTKRKLHDETLWYCKGRSQNSALPIEIMQYVFDIEHLVYKINVMVRQFDF